MANSSVNISSPPTARAVTRGLATLGRWFISLFAGIAVVVGLIFNALIMGLFGRLLGQHVSFGAIVRRVADIGFLALPITALYGVAIGLVCGILLETLLGWTIGFLDTVISVTTVVLVEQLAPLFVGILVAARSGSALAADLGSMAAAHEIDALRGMGLSPERLLITPAILGAILAVPLLTVFMIAAVVLTLAVYLNLSVGNPLVLLLSLSLNAIDLDDLSKALFKGLLFGALIAAIAAAQGLAHRPTLRSVGRGVTSALVISISAILTSNAVLTLVF